MVDVRHRIVVTRDDSVTDEDAVRRVLSVIAKGKTSEVEMRGLNGNTTINYHYCWVTTWTDGIAVETRRKKYKDSADSFHVYRYKDGS